MSEYPEHDKLKKVQDEYPEHDKLKKVQDESQAIGEFLEWLQSGEADDPKYGRSVFLAASRINTEARHLDEGEWELSDTYIDPFPHTTETLLAKFFEIDLEKLEDEKRRMLEYIRQNQG